MANKKRRKTDVTEPTRPEWCGECKRITTNGAVCLPCTLRIRAEEAAAPPPPPPEPPPEPVVLHAPGGCFKCGTPGGMLCGGCSAALHGLPARLGDPKIVYPKPLGPAGW